ncbi:hypothetical protein QJS10_CPA02g00311 [Acorus calamus]|uniref:Uncharacterized protein n=1 Tax=Acorus calamus TaxID=4465 RepID=A0AAV9FCP8_ACOCL|nr:hypothetical protein QJS10_CPA02g00311 [Acorus calamus]
MERILKKYDKEFMKMIMLKHEQTLKEQVYELHRLYRIQKLLMNDMKSTEWKRQITSSYIKAGLNNADNNCDNRRRTRKLLDIEVPAEEDTKDEKGEIEESEIELTLGRGSSSYMKKQEMSVGSDSGASLSSSSSEYGNLNHQRTNTAEFASCEWGLQQYANMNIGYQSQPPWLFHGLSLSTT